MLLPAALALLVLAQVPTASSLIQPGEPVTLEAEDSRYDGRTSVLTANGHCWIHSERISLHADTVEYNRDEGVVTARGNAVAVSGLSAAVADEMVVDLNSGQVDVKAGRFIGLKNTTPTALRAARTPEELSHLGAASFVATGTKIQKLGARELALTNVEMTPCDCDPRKPHWSIRAHHAEVITGDHAWLYFPVITVYNVPVLALPVLYVPLTDRKSGLLVTKPTFSSLSGFGLEQPYFLTLGRSYDVTLSPGYYLGSSSFFGLKGPFVGMDFRYAPSTRMKGELALRLYDDQQPTRVPIPQLDPEAGGPLDRLGPFGVNRRAHRGLRESLTWRHEQDLGADFHDRLDMSLLSDGYLQQDVTTEVLERANEYVRSSGRLYRVKDNDYLGMDVTLRQDVRFGYSLFNADQSWNKDPATPISSPLHGPNTLQRLPALTWAVPESHLAGPLFGGLNAELTRLGGLRGQTENDAPFNAFVPINPIQLGIYPQLDPRGERAAHPRYPADLGLPGNFVELGNGEARDRLDLHPTLSAQLGDSFFRARPYAALREDLYVGEVTGKGAQRGYALGGVELSSEVSRVFPTPGGALRHAFTPSLDFRYVPFVLGSPLNVYDELDRAIGHEPRASDVSVGFTQAVAQITQTLHRRQGTLTEELARLTVGQELDLRQAGALVDTFGIARATLGPARAEGSLRYDTQHQRVSQSWVSGGVRDLRGDQLTVRYDSVLLGGSARLRQGLDMLVGAPYGDAAVMRSLPLAHQVSTGTTVALAGGLSVGYGALFQSQPAPFALPPSAPPRRVPSAAFAFAQQTFGLIFAPACQCWRMEMDAQVSPKASPGGQTVNLFGTMAFRFTLTIANFGNFGN